MYTLIEAIAQKYPHYVDKMAARFEKANGMPLTWENLTKARLYAFVQQLRDEVSDSTARTHCKMLKSVLNLYSDVKPISRDMTEILSVRGDSSVSIYLENREIDRLIKFKARNQLQDVVRNQFVVGCLTGARRSDYLGFTKANIMGKSLVYVSQKTKIKTELPVAPAVKRILSGGKMRLTSGETIRLPLFNEMLRHVCRMVGIRDEVMVYHAGKTITGEKWRFVTSHTARRSFATNLYGQTGNIMLVSRMMGHTNIKQTEGYILNYFGNEPDVDRYFNHFK